MSFTRRGLQPYGLVKRPVNVAHATKQFLTKTVLVVDNDVETALQVMHKHLAREGIMSIMRRTQRFEKPWRQRQRINYEACKAIYDEEMNRKIAFIGRKNRLDPFPGQY